MRVTLGASSVDGYIMWKPRGEDRRRESRQERYEALMWEADLAFERGDLDRAEELTAAAQKALEGEETPLGERSEKVGAGRRVVTLARRLRRASNPRRLGTF